MTILKLLDTVYLMINIGGGAELINTQEKIWQTMIADFIFSPIRQERFILYEIKYANVLENMNHLFF